MRQRLAELEATMAENLQTVKNPQESERNYRILLDESSDPIFTFYPDGQYRYVNKAFADGFTKFPEAVFLTISDAIPVKNTRINASRIIL